MNSMEQDKTHKSMLHSERKFPGNIVNNQNTPQTVYIDQVSKEYKKYFLLQNIGH